MSEPAQKCENIAIFKQNSETVYCFYNGLFVSA